MNEPRPGGSRGLPALTPAGLRQPAAALAGGPAFLGKSEHGAGRVPFRVSGCKHDETRPVVLDERAFAFASLVLTTREDVVVRPYAGRDIAIDLLVEILKHGKSTMRFFGVQLIADLDLPTVQNVDERDSTPWKRSV